MGLVARNLMYVYNGIYPIMILRQYQPLANRLTIIMPRTARLILGCKRHVPVEPNNGVNPESGDTYMIELKEMWSVASKKTQTIFSPIK